MSNPLDALVPPEELYWIEDDEDFDDSQVNEETRRLRALIFQQHRRDVQLRQNRRRMAQKNDGDSSDSDVAPALPNGDVKTPTTDEPAKDVKEEKLVKLDPSEIGKSYLPFALLTKLKITLVDPLRKQILD